MLHAVKRSLARLHEPLTPTAPNGEFADYSQRLSAIKQALKYTSSMFTSANRTWVIQIQEQRQFSERFHEAYPTTTDDVFIIAQQFAQGSQALYDKFTREITVDGNTYDRIHRQVLLYIKEIEELEASYPKLITAKSETNRYQGKLDAMERSRRPTDAAKKTRNLQKMDQQRDAYKRLLSTTVERQKLVYAKHAIVFKAALTAYWLSHEKHVTALVDSLKDTQRFAKAHEAQLEQLDILTLKPDLSVLMPQPMASSPVCTVSNTLSRSNSAHTATEFHMEPFVPVSDPHHTELTSPQNLLSQSDSPTNVQAAPVITASPMQKKVQGQDTRAHAPVDVRPRMVS